jgi:glucodextranase-like protein
MSRLPAHAALAALLVLAGCGWCGRPGPNPAPAPAAAAAAYVPMAGPVVVELSVAQGDVQVRRTSRGPWGPAQLPLSLGFDDSVRTGVGGAATLKIGRDGAIEVRERTEVSVRQLLADRARFRLERGRIGARPGGTAVAVESSGSSAVAEATTGSFAVFNDGKGLVAVVADAGEVKLTAKGGDTVLAAGQGVRVLGNSAPVREAVPRSVLLKVAWPEEKVTRAINVTLRGEADPGAAVAVNGVEARVGADGRFEAELPLAPGTNHVSVTSTDRFGRTAAEQETLRVERRAPPVKAQHEGWQ